MGAATKRRKTPDREAKSAMKESEIVRKNATSAEARHGEATGVDRAGPDRC